MRSLDCALFTGRRKGSNVYLVRTTGKDPKMTFDQLAFELNIQPYELAAFLELGTDIPEGELSEEFITDVLEIVAYDNEHNTKSES